MGEDKKPQGAGPEGTKHKTLAIPDDTEGHKKKMLNATGEPDGGPEEAKHKTLAFPDTDGDTEGHKK